MKKILALVLCLVMLFSLAACGKAEEKETEAPAAAENAQSESSEAAAENNVDEAESDKAERKSDAPAEPQVTIPPENVSMGVVESEPLENDDTDGVIEENTGSDNNPIQTPADVDMSNFDITTLTYELYISMSAEQQKAVIDMFGSPDDFMRWYNAVEAQYKAEHPGIEIGADGTVNLG